MCLSAPFLIVVYWFNPLMWYMTRLAERDLELPRQRLTPENIRAVSPD